MRVAAIFAGIFIALAAAIAQADVVLIKLPPGCKADSAIATTNAENGNRQGMIQDGQVQFSNLLPNAKYDLTIKTSDGKIYQGFDPNWCEAKPASTQSDVDSGPLTDDDRSQIQAILNVPSFYNEAKIVWITLDHNRATVLVQLLRDKPFYNDKGDEVIWRMELWYFENEHGGWARIPNVNKILRRQRFASHAQYHQTTDALIWTPTLGAISIGAGQDLNLTLTPPAAPTTNSVANPVPNPAANPPAASEPEY